MLDRSADAQPHVQARCDRPAGQADLVRIGQPAPIDDLAAGPQGRVQRLGQLGPDRNVLALLDAAANRNNNVGIFEMVGAVVGDELQMLHAASQPIRRRRLANNLAAAPVDTLSRPRRVRANRRHLWTVVGRLDRRQDVAPNGRANLQQVAAVGLDRQRRAVGRQTGIELDGHVRHQRPPRCRSRRQDDVRMVLLDHIQHAGGVGLDQEVLQLSRLGRHDTVGPAVDQLLQTVPANLVAEDHGRQRRPARIGQLTPAAQQLKTHRQHAAGELLR